MALLLVLLPKEAHLRVVCELTVALRLASRGLEPTSLLTVNHLLNIFLVSVDTGVEIVPVDHVSHIVARSFDQVTDLRPVWVLPELVRDHTHILARVDRVKELVAHHLAVGSQGHLI